MAHTPRRKGNEKPAEHPDVSASLPGSRRASTEKSTARRSGKGTKKAQGAVHAPAPGDGGGFGPNIASYRLCCRLLTTAVPLWVQKLMRRADLLANCLSTPISTSKLSAIPWIASCMGLHVRVRRRLHLTSLRARWLCSRTCPAASMVLRLIIVQK